MTRTIACLLGAFAGLCRQAILIFILNIVIFSNLASSSNFFFLSFTEAVWYISQLREIVGRSLGNNGQEIHE